MAYISFAHRAERVHDEFTAEHTEIEVPVLLLNLFNKTVQKRFALLLLTKIEIQHDGRRGLTVAFYGIGFLIKEFFTEGRLDFFRQLSVIRFVGLIGRKDGAIFTTVIAAL